MQLKYIYQKQAYDASLAYYADTMEWAWKSAENELDRIQQYWLSPNLMQMLKQTTALAAKSGAGKAIGGLIGTLGAAAIEFGLVSKDS